MGTAVLDNMAALALRPAVLVVNAGIRRAFRLSGGVDVVKDRVGGVVGLGPVKYDVRPMEGGVVAIDLEAWTILAALPASEARDLNPRAFKDVRAHFLSSIEKIIYAPKGAS